MSYENFRGTYYLNEDKTYEPCDTVTWGAQCVEMRQNDTKHVGSTKLEGKWVSTVWLGLDHQSGDGEPLLFETMVFTNDSPRKDIYMQRYTTWQEAEEGHKRAIAWVKNGCKDED